MFIILGTTTSIITIVNGISTTNFIIIDINVDIVAQRLQYFILQQNIAGCIHCNYL